MKVFRPCVRSNRHDWYIPLSSIVYWRKGLSDNYLRVMLLDGEGELEIYYDTETFLKLEINKLEELFNKD